jgi:hypothetical protein
MSREKKGNERTCYRLPFKTPAQCNLCVLSESVFQLTYCKRMHLREPGRSNIGWVAYGIISEAMWAEWYHM